MVKLYKIITNIIFILIIAVLGIYVYLRFTDKVEIYSVKTGSMEDNIHVGDYVLIYKKDDYSVGDVVTFQKGDYFITHRIIKKENNQIITKGDANNTEDEQINLSDIVGKVIISGGVLNILVEYKFALAAIFIAMYLISCYFGNGKEEIDFDENNKIEEIKKSENNEANSESTTKTEETTQPVDELLSEKKDEENKKIDLQNDDISSSEKLEETIQKEELKEELNCEVKEELGEKINKDNFQVEENVKNEVEKQTDEEKKIVKKSTKRKNVGKSVNK